MDVNTGDVRQLLVTGASDIAAIAVDGDSLFAITDGNTLRAFSLVGGALTSAGTLALPAAGRSLFVADGVATIGAESGFLGGFMTAKVTDLAQLTLLSGVDVNSIGGRALALNGSGLGVAVGTPGGVFGGRVIDVIRTNDPTNTGATQTRYTLGVRHTERCANCRWHGLRGRRIGWDWSSSITLASTILASRPLSAFRPRRSMWTRRPRAFR